VGLEENELNIVKEGRAKKFVPLVEHVTFSGEYAQKKKQVVRYITERCVFSLTDQGMELIEIAPGVDLQRDILDQMDFEPIIKGSPQLMDERIFRPEQMGLKEYLLALPLEDRLIYDPQENLFFVNFEGYTIRTLEDVEAVEQAVSRILSPLNQKVYTIVNYDNFSLLPEVVDAYTDAVARLVDRFYSGVTRYTTSTFLRMKLGDALQGRDVAPHIYESQKEANEALKGLR